MQSNANNVLIKCGGFATQLAKHVDDEIDGDPLWASRYDLKNPEAVVKTHLDFLRNGAQIILSNTYQSSIEGFVKYLGLDELQAYDLIRKSVRLAKQAREEYIKERVEEENGHIEPGLPLVLASIGPYGAHLHDCSEYSGTYAANVTKEKLQQWHRKRIDACLAEGVDGLAIETIPSLMEADAVVEMLLKDYPDCKFWVSFQCKNETSLANGDSFGDAIQTIWNLVKKHNAVEKLFGIGCNCVKPEYVSTLFKTIHDVQRRDIPLLVYSNRGETYDTGINEWVDFENCVPLETFVPEWVRLGARIIGGCCRVYPADIFRMRLCVDQMKMMNLDDSRVDNFKINGNV